jgi:hypothetical protein
MKKIILLSGIYIIFLSGNLLAQGRAYHFGLFFAPNLSWLKPDVQDAAVAYSSKGTAFKYSYGAAIEYDFTPNVGIVTGINILQTGGGLQYSHIQNISATSTPDSEAGTLTRKYTLQYLEIPLALKGSTGELLGNFSFYGKFGLGSGFNLSAKANDEFLPDNSATGNKITLDKINVKKNVSFFRESLIIGIGADYKLGKTAIIEMGLTYSNGFTDVLTGNNTFKPSVKEKAHSHFVELNVGVMF